MQQQIETITQCNNEIDNANEFINYIQYLIDIEEISMNDEMSIKRLIYLANCQIDINIDEIKHAIEDK